MFDIVVFLDSGDPANPIKLSTSNYQADNLGAVLTLLAPTLASWPPFLPAVVGVDIKVSAPSPAMRHTPASAPLKR